MENRIRKSLGLSLLAWLLAFATVANAADCTPEAAKIVSVQGEIEVKRAGTSDWHPVNRNDTFCPGDSIRVGEHSRAAIVMANETLLRLDQNSAIKFAQFETEAPSILEFIRGIGHFISRVPRSLKIETATVDAAIEGTEFVVTVSADETSVTVFEGRVLTQNPQGEVRITDGETVIAKANGAPRKTLLARPRDTVQGAFYFPPVIEMDKTNDVSRASQLLAVGRVEEAQRLLLGIDSGEALALQTVTAIVNNEQERAFDFATDAVKRAPQSAAAHIAMSYAWQAKLDLDQALTSARQAVEYEPGNAIAWARLAELQLSMGELDEALASAQQAIQQDATLSRTQSILGFAYLARIEINEAMAIFNTAIELDQVNPLPRLGLGLAKIRRGKLAEGRREIEIATSLDPNNSIIRSYLGKAYYEERRGPLDATQFAIAKELDPNDPTPWYYDAIRKQSVNRPVGALYNLQKSIELNDNRAVYRSRLLLDSDDAARSASLGRIYKNLGFEQEGLLQGWKSVNTDPANHSGHRLLADTYLSLPRHEIARVSELLQSQLLQPINTNPVQPQLGVARLGILDGTGPSDLTTSEFNPLFTRNGVGLQLNGVIGSNETAGNDLVISGIHDQVSYSIGQFHFETDGFRPNNDQNRNIYNAFIQGTLSPRTSLQAEFRKSDLERGDLDLRFDPTNFDPDERGTEDVDSTRIGLLHQFQRNSRILVSIIAQDEEATLSVPTRDFQGVGVRDGLFTDAQYQHQLRNIQFIGGLAHYDADQKETLTVGPFPTQTTSFDVIYSGAYLYSYIDLYRTVRLTLGGAYETIEDRNEEFDQFNGKFGILWNATPATVVRAAAFRTLQRPQVSTSNVIPSLEPTQVAGFNQQFFGNTGDDAVRYGLGVDHRFNRSLSVGGEISQRDLETPFVDFFSPGLPVRTADWQEQFGRSYLYWSPRRDLALSMDLLYEKFDRETVFRDDGFAELETVTVPSSIRYFHPSGLRTFLVANYVNQKGTFVIGPPSPNPSFTTGQDNFWVLNASLGFLLPSRAGLVTLEARNILDEQFQFQDTDPANPRFVAERFYMFRLSFNTR